MHSYRKKVWILTGITIILAAIFILYGLNEQNIGFFLPKRLKKTGAILLTACCIGYSSVTFQTITNNKILTPSVMGLDSLYLFIQTAVVFFFGSGQLRMMSGSTNFFLSVGFMILSSCLLFLLLFRQEKRNVHFLVLSGMILGSFFSGLSTFMQVLLDPNEFLILQDKMFASFNNVNEGLFFICTATLIFLAIITIKDYPLLDALSLGVDLSVNLGINYRRLVFKNLAVTAVLVSISTALTGPITFLGILTASLSRELLKTYRHTWRIAGSILLGSSSLLLGQLLVERVFRFNTTISVIVNFIGGLYFIYLMLKEAKQ